MMIFSGMENETQLQNPDSGGNDPQSNLVFSYFRNKEVETL